MSQSSCLVERVTVWSVSTDNLLSDPPVVPSSLGAPNPSADEQKGMSEPVDCDRHPLYAVAPTLRHKDTRTEAWLAVKQKRWGETRSLTTVNFTSTRRFA